MLTALLLLTLTADCNPVSLKAEAARVRTWTGAWGATWAGLTLGQVAAAPAFEPRDRVDLYVGAGSTALALGLMLAMPLELHEGCDEKLFAEDANAEALGVSPLMHVLNVALNLGVGLFLGLAYGHWES